LVLLLLGAWRLAEPSVAAAATVDDATKAQLDELAAQRELVLARIIHGSDTDRAIGEFVSLHHRRLELLGRTPEALANHKAIDTQSLDYEAGWRCTLSADPTRPVDSDEGRFRGDWGKVVQKHSLRTVPKNELDNGTPVTLYEIEGRARRYTVRADRMGTRTNEALQAEIGDLVLLCNGGEDLIRDLPPPWDKVRIVRSGLAGRIAQPPRIADKAQWNPRHITHTRFFWAIHDVKWKYPPEQFVLCYLDVFRDLGQGRFEIKVDNDKSFLIEAAAKLQHKELLQPGRGLWMILGFHRFDRDLQKLVLTLVDVEEHYVTPK
jgi:hypothetical protein